MKASEVFGEQPLQMADYGQVDDDNHVEPITEEDETTDLNG